MSSLVPAHGIHVTDQDHKSMQAIVGFDSTRLSSPTHNPQYVPNAVANRIRRRLGRPLTESNERGTRS